MSQKQLASAIGVSTQTINAWEKDITIIKGENLIALPLFQRKSQGYSRGLKIYSPYDFKSYRKEQHARNTR